MCPIDFCWCHLHCLEWRRLKMWPGCTQYILNCSRPVVLVQTYWFPIMTPIPHCVSASVAICFGPMSGMLAILLFFDRATFLHLSTFWYIGIGMKRIWHQDDVTHCCVETMTLRYGFLLIWQWLWFNRDHRKKNRSWVFRYFGQCVVDLIDNSRIVIITDHGNQ